MARETVQIIRDQVNRITRERLEWSLEEDTFSFFKYVENNSINLLNLLNFVEYFFFFFFLID